ncbi:MAG TPA: hypothetical protein VMH41_13530 [Mycobacteriales bacterium]|nr:hypothetical protein [Mycobacteriales bacterium]
MAIDPDIVNRYSQARHTRDQAAAAAPDSATDPAFLEAQEDFREALSAYLLDLEINGMSVPADLQSELDALTDVSEPPANG